MQTLVQHALEETLRLLEIPSPTGHTQAICDHLARRLSDMGFVPVRLRKGGVVCTLGGEGRPLALSAHVDTLGLMVRQIKDNGRLAFARVGGVSYQALETENVQVFTRDGRSYTGVVQRWNQHTGPMAHGSKYHRGVGSMGANSDPSRVFKNKHMPGHYGVERVTVQNLEIVRVDAERNLLLIKGAVPGPNGGLLLVRNTCKA